MLKEIGDFMERPAGHNLMFMAMIGIGVGMLRAGVVEGAHEMIAGAVGALLYSMKPKGNGAA